jgi:hypothetical protein
VARVYSTQLLIGQAPAGDQLSAGPFAGTVVIRDVECLFGAAPDALQVFDGLGNPLIYQVLAELDIEGGGATQWQGRLVLPPGSSIVVQSLEGNPFAAVVSGYLLAA